jgi:hypothetical protein
MNYFMTEFGDHEEFLDKGQRVDNKVLEAILCECGKEVFSKAPAVVLGPSTLVDLPGYNFTHGGFHLNGHMSTMFYYFSDIQMGMLAVAMSMTGPTKFLRFSGMCLLNSFL